MEKYLPQYVTVTARGTEYVSFDLESSLELQLGGENMTQTSNKRRIGGCASTSIYHVVIPELARFQVCSQPQVLGAHHFRLCSIWRVYPMHNPVRVAMNIGDETANINFVHCIPACYLTVCETAFINRPKGGNRGLQGLMSERSKKLCLRLFNAISGIVNCEHRSDIARVSLFPTFSSR